MSDAQPKYEMKISRLTIDKLGVKLYDKIYAVIAELISNSYDADATQVCVSAPMGQYLASKVGDKAISKNVSVIVEDNGCGMTPQEMREFYLIVGKERRNDVKRGELSTKFKRKVMGRKGVGKLAPFGVCRIVEIISAGGEKITRDEIDGYETAHIILNRDDMMKDESAVYEPVVGELDEKLSPGTFTKVILREFEYRKIPKIKDLERQLSQRFGISSDNWKIKLLNSDIADENFELPLEGFDDLVDAPEPRELFVGEFKVAVMSHTRVDFMGVKPTLVCESNNARDYKVICCGEEPREIFSGFFYNGKFYPVVGWMGYAEQPYKDELMAGVRIYCRGKFVAQTGVFNLNAGFTGQHTIRSYLVGALDADWLDEEEDLIQTDRRDILWSHEIASEFQNWGQDIVKYIGRVSSKPMRETMQKQFFEQGNVIERIKTAFPGFNQKKLRETATAVAKSLGRSLRGDELNNEEAIENLVDLCIMLAPIQNLDKELREAAETEITPLSVINGILKTARIAETAALGHIVEKRIAVMKRLNQLKNDGDVDECDLQELIETAPWLINPQWVPVTQNQSLKVLKQEFEKFYEEKIGEKITLISFKIGNKRPDFVCFSQDGHLQVIEIKVPKHKLDKTDWTRLQRYFDLFEEFFTVNRDNEFLKIVTNFHVTLICDEIKLTGSDKSSFSYQRKEKKLTHINWSDFLLRTTRAHQEFLDQAESVMAGEG